MRTKWHGFNLHQNNATLSVSESLYFSLLLARLKYQFLTVSIVDDQNIAVVHQFVTVVHQYVTVVHQYVTLVHHVRSY